MPRSISRLGSIDHAICLFSSKLRPRRAVQNRHVELGIQEETGIISGTSVSKDHAFVLPMAALC